MKKLFVLLLALTVMGLVVSAQDAPKIAWNLNVWTGFGLLSESEHSGSAFVPYNYDYEGGGEYRLKMTVTAADGNSGFMFRTYTDPTLGTSDVTTQNFFRLKRAYGWAKFADGLVTVYGGRLGVNPSGPNYGWVPYGDTQGKDGMMVNLAPVAGLNIGWFQPIATLAGVDNEATKQFAKGQLSVGYTVTDMVTVNFGYLAGLKSKDTNVFGGFNLLAVKDLTAYAEFNVKAPALSDKTVMTIDSNVAYTMGALGLNLYASLSTSKDGAKNSITEYNIEPSVSYELNKMATFGFVANVWTYPAVNTVFYLSPTDGINAYGGFDAAGDPTYVDGQKAKLAIGAGPNVTLKAGNATIVIGDFYGMLPEYAGAAKTNVNTLYCSMDFAL